MLSVQLPEIFYLQRENKKLAVFILPEIWKVLKPNKNDLLMLGYILQIHLQNLLEVHGQ
jgi:hypothetical protein